MIFVPVGNNDPHNFVTVIFEILEIRDDLVDPQDIVVGEHDPGIDDQNLIIVFVDHHVFTDFPQTTQGNDA